MSYRVIAVASTLLLLLASATFAAMPANPYSNSAHGSTVGTDNYGVQRLGAPYVKGNCSHCHEQHASLEGAEPTPADGASRFALFADPYTSDTDNFCIDCHDGTTTVATTAITNHSYSYRAGNLGSDFVSSISDSFDTTGSIASTHNLSDIRTLLSGSIGAAWGFSSTAAYIQPCEGCHNPHVVQGDPANSPSGRKTLGSRGYPISRPSDYQAATGWEPWGDETGEKMSDYAGALTYQAPYYGGSTTTYEPEGNGTHDGSNLTDFNTFCIDCHNISNNSISSTNLGTLKAFDWASEQHGRGAANDDTSRTDMGAPFIDTSMGIYVLSCLDCHEPHGSDNIYLIRTSVNGGAVSLTQYTGPEGTVITWDNLCSRCHAAASDLQALHHTYKVSGNCSNCHFYNSNAGNAITNSDPKVKDCTNCHFHGSSALTYKTF